MSSPSTTVATVEMVVMATMPTMMPSPPTAMATVGMTVSDQARRSLGGSRKDRSGGEQG
jgi:hypothetical protein